MLTLHLGARFSLWLSSHCLASPESFPDSLGNHPRHLPPIPLRTLSHLGHQSHLNQPHHPRRRAQYHCLGQLCLQNCLRTTQHQVVIIYTVVHSRTCNATQTTGAWKGIVRCTDLHSLSGWHVPTAAVQAVHDRWASSKLVLDYTLVLVSRVLAHVGARNWVRTHLVDT